MNGKHLEMELDTGVAVSIMTREIVDSSLSSLPNSSLTADLNEKGTCLARQNFGLADSFTCNCTLL